MKRVRFEVLWFPLLILGCAQTGDPTQGGLFGWSESMARARQETLHNEASAADEKARRASATSAELNSEAAAKQRAIDRLNRDLAHLEEENRELRAEFGRLVQRRASVSGSLAVLQRELARPNQAVEAQRFNYTSRGIQTRVTSIGDQNRRLHEAILLMLE